MVDADMPPAGGPVALVIATDGVALTWAGGHREVPTADPASVVAEFGAAAPRWVWWSAHETATPLVQAGVRPKLCWDLAAVSRLLYGRYRADPASIWAASEGLPEPPAGQGEVDLFDLEHETGAAVRTDGQLSREWLRGGFATSLDRAAEWARLILRTQQRQEALLLDVPDPRRVPSGPPLALLTARAESAAALLAVELTRDGLPLDLGVAGRLIADVVGERPADPAAEAEARRSRDSLVLNHFPDMSVDLRSPLQVKELLSRVGVNVPDTRSWRLEPFAPSSPPIAALLAWRKAERIATTFGWTWLERHAGQDGRLRGAWSAADGAAGRMSAQAGLHNMPAELRPAVRADDGYVFVRADLGQVEPRVLAVVSGDAGLAAAAREDDMYAPVAAQLGSDRPTAKVAVLAAMYGQTSGAAGAALKDMERAYPTAIGYLRDAEFAGREGRSIRTYGGRLLRMNAVAPAAHDGNEDAPPTSNGGGQGRFARNAMVQGAAAELFKAWAATVRDGLATSDGGIVLCLHDELLLHVPLAEQESAARLLHDALAATVRWWASGSGVRFIADVATGASWTDAH